MDGAAIGLYTLALCLDWETDGFTLDEIRDLATSQQFTPKVFEKCWGKVRACFGERSGRFFNARLKVERDKQREWRRKSSKGGKIGSAKRWSPPDKGGVRVVTPKDDTPSPTPSPTPVTTKTKDSASAKAPRDSWLVPSARVWEARFGAGTFPWGEFGKNCKALKPHHAPATIADHLNRFLDVTPAEFAIPSKFAKTFGQWAPIDSGALVDEFGCMTDLGEKETRSIRRVS